MISEIATFLSFLFSLPGGLVLMIWCSLLSGPSFGLWDNTGLFYSSYDKFQISRFIDLFSKYVLSSYVTQGA